MAEPRSIRVDPTSPDDQAVAAAAAVLQRGGVLLYPTDTTYALGVNALDPTAVERVFKIKGRSASKPIHVVVDSLEAADHYGEVSEAARTLARAFLPGPLTLVIVRRSIVPEQLVAGKHTVGIRIPHNQTCLRLARLVNFPITTTSANLSGAGDAFDASSILDQLGMAGREIDLVVDQGSLPIGPPSTVIDVSIWPPIVIREGAIPTSQLMAALGL